MSALEPTFRDPRQDPDARDVVAHRAGDGRREVIHVFHDVRTTYVVYVPLVPFRKPPPEGLIHLRSEPLICTLPAWRRWARNGTVWDKEVSDAV